MNVEFTVYKCSAPIGHGSPIQTMVPHLLCSWYSIVHQAIDFFFYRITFYKHIHLQMTLLLPKDTRIW